MDLIFPAFLVASALHMIEEYALPGGLTNLLKRLNPQFASLVTARMAIVVNGLQLVLCIIVILVGTSSLAFSLSIASLVFINGLAHIGACVRVKGYAPGAVTGTLIYLPLASYAYYLFAASGQLTLAQAVVSGILGVLYQAMPLGYFFLGSVMRQA